LTTVILSVICVKKEDITSPFNMKTNEWGDRMLQ
jgi:hypothetical protein